MIIRVTWRYLVIVLALLLVSSCGQANVVGIQVPANIGLDAETLQRIDEINRTIKNGFEVGPQTRNDIEEINQTLRNGIGLNPETRQTIERLLADIEAGVEIGLDYETRQTLEKLIATLGNAPGDWGDTLRQVINTLEGSTSKVADKMAREVGALLDQAKGDLEEVGSLTGAEFRCNVQFLHAEGMNTINDFIGLDLVDRLNVIIFGKKIPPSKGDPAVCQVLPLQVTLEKAGQEYRPTKDVIVITGYNFSALNRPEVYLGQGDTRLKSIKALVTTPYVIQLNLQPLKDDLATATVGMEIVSVWLDGAATNEIPIMLPKEAAPEPQAVVLARTNIYKGPGTRYHVVWPGDANQSFKVIGRNGDRTWWQIEYKDKNDNPQKGWISAGEVTVSHVEDVPIASVPNPPTASFEAVPVQGDPFSIQFKNHSVGEHPEFAWDFGDNSNPSAEETPLVHRYGQATQYTVTLKVTDDWGQGEASQPVSIVVQEPVTAQFAASTLTTGPITSGELTGLFPLDVTFTNVSTGPITSGEWDFGDGTNSKDMSATVEHRYENPGPYQVTLTVRDDSVGSSSVKNDVWIRVKPFFKGSVFFQWFRDLPGEDDVDTRIDSNQYHCGIVGLEVWGDIEEEGRGDIVKAYLTEQGGTWHIIKGFRTEDPAAEKWNINIMCLDRRLGNSFIHDPYGWAGRDRYPGPESDSETSLITTNMNANEYLCGIVGFKASDGDIQENGDQGTVFEVMPYLIGGEDPQTWRLKADVATHETHERWDLLDVLCVVNDPTLFAQLEFTIKPGAQDAYITDADNNRYFHDNYICGLVGMSIKRADIQEKVKGEILTGFLGWNNQGWFAQVNFLTEGSAFKATRGGSTLCVSTTIAEER